MRTFDDTLDWWYAGDEHGAGSHPGRYQQGWSSVDVPKTGTTIKVKRVRGDGVMVVRVELTPTAKEQTVSVADQFGMTQIATLSRLID